MSLNETLLIRDASERGGWNSTTPFRKKTNPEY